MRQIICFLIILMLISGCAFSPVKRPDINRYSPSFPAYRYINLSSEDTTTTAKSTLEAMGYEIQSTTPELGTIRTTVRSLLTPDYCDCGTWNGRTLSGAADSSIIITIKPRGSNETFIQINHYCAVKFTGRNLWGGITRSEVFQCASKGIIENEFWETLDKILDVRKK